MGEAKRRRQAGFDPKPKLHLGCFIAKSHASDAHAVYLGIGRGNKGFDLVHISAHKYVTKAYEILGDCKQILEDFKHEYQNSFDIRDAFVTALIAKLGDYPSDDGKFLVSDNHLSSIYDWAAKGNILGIDKLPPGIDVEVVKPRVTKKWKIFSHRVKGYKKSDYGDPSADHQFFISQTDSLPFLIKVVETDKIVVMPPCSRYVSAAYIADFINEHNKNLLTTEELIRLLNEANRLQGLEMAK
jgi:hypothetical protein